MVERMGIGAGERERMERERMERMGGAMGRRVSVSGAAGGGEASSSSVNVLGHGHGQSQSQSQSQANSQAHLPDFGMGVVSVPMTNGSGSLGNRTTVVGSLSGSGAVTGMVFSFPIEW